MDSANGDEPGRVQIARATLQLHAALSVTASFPYWQMVLVHLTNPSCGFVTFLTTIPVYATSMHWGDTQLHWTRKETVLQCCKYFYWLGTNRISRLYV